jgi:hypothetical protein
MKYADFPVNTSERYVYFKLYYISPLLQTKDNMQTATLYFSQGLKCTFLIDFN